MRDLTINDHVTARIDDATVTLAPADKHSTINLDDRTQKKQLRKAINGAETVLVPPRCVIALTGNAFELFSGQTNLKHIDTERIDVSGDKHVRHVSQLRITRLASRVCLGYG